MQLGRPVDLLATDVVFALDVPHVHPERDVVLNVSGLLWANNPHVDNRRYRRILAAIYAGLVGDGRQVSLLAHVLDSPASDNDIPSVIEFAASLPAATEVIVPADLDEVRRIVASATVVIGSRMHACLNALSCGTPAIALAYSRKFAPLFGDLGWDGVVELSTRQGPTTAVLELVARPNLAVGVPGVLERAHRSLAQAELVLRVWGEAAHSGRRHLAGRSGG